MTEVGAGGNHGDTHISDWGTQVSNAFFDLVDKVRGKTTGPLLKVARALVYGLVILVAAMMLLVLGLIGLVRLADIAIPGAVWSAYLVLGLLFLGAGAFCWSRRTP